MTLGSPRSLRKVRKIRSFGEVVTRGGQAISAFREQRRGGAQLPNGKEFEAMVDRRQFGTGPVIAESLWQSFFRNGNRDFFVPFRDAATATNAFRTIFRGPVCTRIINSAENIVDGRIDLLGLKNLYVGTDIQWHREPLSLKRSPLRHWKAFDDLDTGETGNKKILWELNRHQHFFLLGAGFWLTGDERFGETFARHLESWMEQDPPGIGVNWSSSLEVAFRAMSWIWAFHFFRDSDHLTPDLFKRAIQYLYLHGRHIERYLSKYYSPNTHLTGEGLGLYYLGTQLPFLSRAKHWKKLGESIMFTEIDRQILPDGVYFEQSTWYQRYTVDLYLHFLILRSLQGQSSPDAPLANTETRLQKAFDFLMHITMPDGTTPLIGDDDGGRVLPLTTAEPDDFRGSLAVAGALLDRPDYKFVAGRPSQELFWLLGPAGVAKYDDMTATEPAAASKEFRDGGYYVMRDGWEDTDNCLVIDCGEVGSLAGGHGHADALAFEVAVHGQTLLVDSGTYTYHDSRELRDHFRSTTAHNSLVIDSFPSSEPGEAFNWKTRAHAARNEWIAEKRFDFFEGSHSGYERLEEPATHTRSVLFLKNDYWIVRDRVETAGEHEYSLNFHYARGIRPGVSVDADFVGDVHHRVYTFDGSGSWDQKESWISNHHGNRVNAPLLRFRSKGVGTQEFFTFILPVSLGIHVPEASEVISYKGRAFIVRFAGYTDLLVFNDESDELVDTGLFDTGFKYTWMRLADDNSLPDEFVVLAGDALKVGSTPIFNGTRIAYAAGRRFGTDFYITTENGRTTKSLAP